jgi:hypothetical protein
VRADSSNRPAPELKAASDIQADPRFVDADRGDFRLRADSTLLNKGQFAYLGALPPHPPAAAQPQTN